MISNLVGGKIVEFLSLGSEYSSLVGVFLLQILDEVSLENLSLTHLLVGFALYFLYSHLDVFRQKWSTFAYPDTKTIEIYESWSIEKVVHYFRNYPEYLEKDLSVSIGNIYESDSSDTKTCLSPGQKIKFNDAYFQVEGWLESYSVEYEVTEERKSSKKMRLYIKITILENGKMPASAYLQEIQQKNREDCLKSSEIELVYRKMTNVKSYVSRAFYDGKKQSKDALKAKYLDTFFHPDKERLIELIEKVDSDQDFFRQFGQEGQLNLILHGPPGTGKSTFAFRIAMLLGRDIESVDLSLLDKKEDAYRAFKVDHKEILLLEEIDNAIDFLDQRINHVSEIENQDADDNDKDESKRKKKKKTNEIPDLFTQLNRQRNDMFRTRDLFEILQGPVPSPGRIIIATTNHFKKIQRKHPALFRQGRLTPVYFGYLGEKQLNELSNVYFGRNLDLGFQLNLPTASILEFAMEAKLHGDFDSFTSKLLAAHSKSLRT